MTVFAWPGIQGEKSTVRITAVRKNLLRGLVTSVDEPTPLRIEPPCPYFGPCGGCQWQHITYEGQLRFKSAILAAQLTRLGGLSDVEGLIAEPIPSPEDYHYRNTSHFAIDGASRSIGYFKRDSHSVVPVEKCPISNSGINTLIPAVNTLLQLSGAEPGGPGPTRGVMRVWHVTLRHSQSTGQSLLIFHTRAEGRAVSRAHGARSGRGHAGATLDIGPSLEPDAGASPEIPLVRREVRRAISRIADEIEGAPLALTVVEVMEDGTINRLGATRAAGSVSAEAAADVVSGRLVSSAVGGQEVEEPLGAWVEKLGGRHYWIAPEAFFQANTRAAEALLSVVMASVPERAGLIVDAHAGVGTFGLAAAGQAKRVLLFETSHAAIASGRWTALATGVRNAEFTHGRAEVLLGRLPPGQTPDLVILDPPRTGCHPDLLRAIEERHVPRIIYVSCDPSTLARDVKLISASYSLRSARVVDMFPQTFHIETVAVLERV